MGVFHKPIVGWNFIHPQLTACFHQKCMDLHFSSHSGILLSATDFQHVNQLCHNSYGDTVASQMEIGKNSLRLSQTQPAKSSAVHKLNSNLTNMKIWSLLLQVGSTMILTESPSLFESTIPIDALITKIGSVDAPTMHNSEWSDLIRLQWSPLNFEGRSLITDL